MHNDEYCCPVCGYLGLAEPPYDKYGCASFDICPCCGTEFGYDDNKESHNSLRLRWVKKGMLWFSSSTTPPTNWSPLVQLEEFNNQVN